jgi:hypothetical protein
MRLAVLPPLFRILSLFPRGVCDGLGEFRVRVNGRLSHDFGHSDLHHIICQTHVTITPAHSPRKNKLNAASRAT